MSAQTIVIIVSEDWYFMSHRLPLANALKDQGYDVVVCTNFDQHKEKIESLGFKTHDLGLERNKIALGNFVKFYKIEQELRRLYNPALIINVAMFILISTMFANILSPVRKMHLITGMGYIYTEDTTFTKIAKVICAIYFRTLSFFKKHTVVVQNGDDRQFFERHGFKFGHGVHLIAGSGVDCEAYYPAGQPQDKPIVTCVARMLESKGIYEFIEAARILKVERKKPYELRLVGPIDPHNPQCIDPDFLQKANDEGVVNWQGPSDDVLSVNQDAALAVLPSWREGMPKSLLEAAACGLPMVSYDVTGCRDVVRNGENGISVPFKNIKALADAIEKIIEDEDLRHKMGKASRQFALDHFSTTVIKKQFVSLVNQKAGE